MSTEKVAATRCVCSHAIERHNLGTFSKPCLVIGCDCRRFETPDDKAERERESRQRARRQQKRGTDAD